MLRYTSLVLLVSALLPVVSADTVPSGPATTYASCQRTGKSSPWDNCPAGTIYVSLTDSKANFTSVQSAIASIPNNTTPYYILIDAGNYTEQLNVTRQGPLTLLGLSDRPSNDQVLADINVNSTISSYANNVAIHWNSANYGEFSDNVYTGVLTVGPNLNATLTGSGTTGFAVPADTPFGCSNFRVYNIDFNNTYKPYSDGPAHAVGVSRANAGFYSCGFYSYQDTVYIGKLGNAYFYDNIIAGQTDFLYGFGTAYIEQSTLSMRACGGGVTAWKGTNTTFTNRYGIYIDRSQLIAANYTISKSMKGKCALGRPWNDADRTIYMDTYFDASIKPAGFEVWSSGTPRVDNNTFMATWNDTGPGYNKTAEELSNITKVLSDDEVAAYRYPVDVFQDQNGTFPNIAWIDSSVLVGP